MSSHKNPFEARHVDGRRGGPMKQPLSRGAIVEEALRQLTVGGLEGMSLRKIAKALETGPASLYVYVEDLKALQALVLDHALGAVSMDDEVATGWRERLLGVLKSYAIVLSSSPGLAQIAFETIAVGPNALRVMERLLALLREGDIDLTTSAWSVDLLMLYVTAIAAERGGGADPAADGGAASRAIAAVKQEAHPHIYAASVELLTGTGEDRLWWALEVLLQGILHTPAPRSGRTQAAGHPIPGA